jgi:hypothetical protein
MFTLMPCAAGLAATSGNCSARLSSAFTRWTLSVDVLAGAITAA